MSGATSTAKLPAPAKPRRKKNKGFDRPRFLRLYAGFVYQGVSTQVTVSLGDGARLVALEQNTYRARSDERWEPGAKVKLGWHPEHCLVLR